MEHEYVTCLSTVPDVDTGKKIARILVHDGIVACVNIIQGITSIYTWKDEVHEDTECLLIIKTRVERFADVERRITSLHPYECPEIVSLPILQGYAPFLKWIDEHV